MDLNSEKTKSGGENRHPENIKRDNNEEENWRIKSNGNQNRHDSNKPSKYRDNIDVNWRIKSTENSEKEINRDSRRGLSSRRLRKASRHRQSLSQEELLLPSQVMDEEYIYFPSDLEAIDNMKSATAGKWLVYGNYSMSSHDETWVKLLPLCKEGILIGMKASTSIITDAQQFMGGEIILCYTADADDVNNVKKAGDAIRRAIGDSDEILYYKTNAASAEGLYNIEGCKAVTKYRLTPKGSFYIRDQQGWWAPV